MAYQSWSVVFGEQPSAAKWNILGTNDASFNDGTGIADGVIKPEHLKNGSSSLNTWVWDDFTATLSGRFDDAKWNKTGKYIRMGDLIVVRLKLVANTTTPMSGGTTDAIISLPVTAVDYSVADVNFPIGKAGLYDSGSANYDATVYFGTTTTMKVRAHPASASFVSNDPITSTSPFTWTTNDQILLTAMYQAAA